MPSVVIRIAFGLELLLPRSAKANRGQLSKILFANPTTNELTTWASPAGIAREQDSLIYSRGCFLEKA